MTKSFSQYVSWVLGIIDSSGIVSDRSQFARIRSSRSAGILMAPARSGFARSGSEPIGLIFIDGAFLRFIEQVVIRDDGAVIREMYSYHYQRPDGYFFRYDKLIRPLDEPIQRVLEPQRHLHVGQSSPRFPTHSTNLEEVLGLIKHNFYSSSM